MNTLREYVSTLRVDGSGRRRFIKEDLAAEGGVGSIENWEAV